MNQRIALALFGLFFGLTAACGTGTANGGSSSVMSIDEVSNGFGRMLPHQVFKPDANGNASTELVAIRNVDDLLANVTANTPILPATQWPEAAILPNGELGNHYIFARFTQPIDLDTVLDASPAAVVNSNLKGAITVVATDALTGSTTPLRGRVFIGGKTYAGTATGIPSALPLQTWVTLNTAGQLVAETVGGDTPGLGFPGTESSSPLPGAADLVSENTLVFVIDEDGDLTTHETFPTGVQVRMRISEATGAQNGKKLSASGLASATVGVDTISPEIAQSPPPFSIPVISPGNGDTNIDPLTNVVLEFTEPVQLLSLGELPGPKSPLPSSAVLVQFGPSAAKVTVPFNILPTSVYDLSRYELIPAFNFPGAGPPFLQCGIYNRVDVIISAGQFDDLAGNSNTLGPSTFFLTGEGPGLVNAPVAPDVIYVGRVGSEPGISVIDLNGFGQSTGNPTYDLLDPIVEGNSNFPNNPNVATQGSMLTPPLARGGCTVDGGSAGVFTLTLDSALNNKLVRKSVIQSVGDMMLGHALDTSFNNGPPPFGCQSGGGNLCAQSGFKQLSPIIAGANTLGPAQPGQFGSTSPGGENIISWSPHPNPPPLIFPPLCISPYIGGQEPTSINTSLVTLLQNLLAPGAFPLGQPDLGKPPSGLLTIEQNSFFLGPTPPQSQISACLPYQIRQQIGHFLYMIDSTSSEVVVLNSNRFSVIDRVSLPDPTQLAISPNLSYLAVTNAAADLVSFIDIDPNSSTLHQVVFSVKVGSNPQGIAWDPDNEDILVCNEGDSTVSVISAASFAVRKVIKNQLSQPFDVAITPRQFGFGFQRGVYYGFILQRDGAVSLFESGPSGINGWGFDDVVGQPTFKFKNPKMIQPDHIYLPGGCWIVHEGQVNPEGVSTGLAGGAVSNLILKSGLIGQIPLGAGQFTNPQLRDLDFEVAVSVGSNQISGIPTDIAFDDQRNLGGLPGVSNQYSASSAIPTNGKGLIRAVPGAIVNANEPQFMFVAVPNAGSSGGVVDVIRLSSGFLRIDTNSFEAGIQSIPVDGATFLMDYFRQ